MRHQSYAHRLFESLNRRQIRAGTSSTPKKNIKIPLYWGCDSGFNPYHVRKHHKSIAHSIRHSLASRSYTPRPAVIHHIPKAGEGVRALSVFQVADQAISRVLFDQLMTKNASRLNPKCYAYRKDKTVHDAVLNIAYELKGSERIYLAEYDYRDFFSSIDHGQVERLLSDRRFYVTKEEKRLVMEFLGAPRQSVGEYATGPRLKSTVGIPMGTSVSLFVANLMTYPIAEELDKLGVGFAFFSDDSVIWSESYDKISQAANVISDTAKDLGLSINIHKSGGIRLFTPSGAPREIAGTDSVSFLGHRMDGNHISMGDNLIHRAKQQLSHLIFSNLIREPIKGNVNVGRLMSFDQDYIVLVSQIRRYLYGSLSEAQVRRYLTRAAPRIHYRGLMSFFPVVDDDALLKSLDSWLIDQVHLALNRRTKLIREAGFKNLPGPHFLSRKELEDLKWGNVDLSLPSFLRMGKLLRSAARAHGANVVANPRLQYYYS